MAAADVAVPAAAAETEAAAQLADLEQVGALLLLLVDRREALKLLVAALDVPPFRALAAVPQAEDQGQGQALKQKYSL